MDIIKEVLDVLKSAHLYIDGYGRWGYLSKDHALDDIEEMMSIIREMATWTAEWPTEPGLYWFIGHAFGGDRLEMGIVKVRRISNGWMYEYRGHFMYRSETRGLFCKAILPTWPDTLDIVG